MTIPPRRHSALFSERHRYKSTLAGPLHRTEIHGGETCGFDPCEHDLVLGMSIHVTIVGPRAVIRTRNRRQRNRIQLPYLHAQRRSQHRRLLLCGHRKRDIQAKEKDYVPKEFIASLNDELEVFL